MSPEAQRIAIAEACGYIWERGCFGTPLGQKKNEPGPYEDLPDYLNDLNAMHEAEKLLTASQYRAFVDQLREVVFMGIKGGAAYCARFSESATAAQRAEAFLRAIGKLEDGK